MIKQKQDEVNGKQKVVTDQSKVNVFEKDKNMRYTKANAALLAKLEFIESKYDYSSQAKQLSVQDFKELIASNTNVNQTFQGFTGKLENVQKEIQQIETMKNMMMWTIFNR